MTHGGGIIVGVSGAAIGGMRALRARIGPESLRTARGSVYVARGSAMMHGGRGVIGALPAGREAQDEGRDVMAVPGHPTWPGASGTNALLRDGAAVIRHAGDVLEELRRGPRRAAEEETDTGDEVLAALRRDAPSSVEEIAVRCGLGLPKLLARLGELEIAERVRRLPGPLFVRS